MTQPGPDNDFNQDLMDDFFLDFTEAHQSCENTLIDLEHDPSSSELLNALFRSIHTIKGNLVYVGMKDLTPLIQSVEDVLDGVRKHSLTYDASLSDVIMLAMDKTKLMVEARMSQQSIPLQPAMLDQLCQQISCIAEVKPADRMGLVRDILSLLDPSTVIELAPAETNQRSAPRALSVQPDQAELLTQFGVQLNQDIGFFQHLIQPLEQRSHYWHGRTARLLQLALSMNQQAGAPVEPDQLAVAVFMHDIGMAFLPMEILHKTSPLNEEELQRLSQHPQLAWQLLHSMKKWQQASFIVQEHHERVDGQGYPRNLTGEHICPGAKIMAIVDAFDARTHERAYSAQIKRPFVRAILEINRCAGTHFDAEWVEVFNEVARQQQKPV